MRTTSWRQLHQVQRRQARRRPPLRSRPSRAPRESNADATNMCWHALVRSDRVGPQQRVYRDGAPCPRNAGADLPVLLLLMIAEEDVAMVDLAVDGDHVDGAEATFAALAVVHHLKAAGVEHIKHRAFA